MKESVKRILALLPGVDCGGFGGCGCPTCEACASAIADGAAITLCPAVDTETVAAIAAIMGTEPIAVQKKTAFVKCAGYSAGKKRFREAGFTDCASAANSGFARDECAFGCIGLGSCVERCHFGALSMDNGSIYVDREKCVGCEACVSGCVQALIHMVPSDATNFIPCSSKADEAATRAVCSYGCIGCGDCAFSCPKDAIEMMCGENIEGRYAAIDYDRCEGCVTCTVKCRKKIITDTLHDLKRIKESVSLVRCTGGYASHLKLQSSGFSSCREVVDAKVDLDGMDVCEYACFGFGDCVKACRFDAISTDSGIAKIDPEKCVGCGDCVHACPQHKIESVPYFGVKQAACQSQALPERRMEVCYTGCIACGDCAENCPTGAIDLSTGYPEIDAEKCVNCGVCQYVCSRHLLDERIVPEYIYLQRQAGRKRQQKGGQS